MSLEYLRRTFFYFVVVVVLVVLLITEEGCVSFKSIFTGKYHYIFFLFLFLVHSTTTIGCNRFGLFNRVHDLLFNLVLLFPKKKTYTVFEVLDTGSLDDKCAVSLHSVQ